MSLNHEHVYIQIKLHADENEKILVAEQIKHMKAAGVMHEILLPPNCRDLNDCTKEEFISLCGGI